MSEKITLPRLFLTMEEGLITKWYKKAGDKIKEGESLFSIEAEKASQDVESPVSGILAKILIKEGENAEVGADIAVIAGEDEIWEETDEEKTTQDSISEETENSMAVSSDKAADIPGRPLRMTPKARAAAKQRGADFKKLSEKYGSSRITEKEIDEFFKEMNKSDKDAESSENLNIRKIKATHLRKSIAKKMRLSLQKTAQLTNGMDADMTDLLEIIKELKSKKKEISLSGFIIKLCADALKDHPGINSKYIGEEEIIIEESVNIGFAVETDLGLFVPVIKDADKKDVFMISSEVYALAAKARSGELKNSEMQGGTFTITNVGMYGISYFTPIINYPESAILGIGAAKISPVYMEEKKSFEPRHIAMLNLSYDHRVIDGAPASRFLQAVKKNIESIKDAVF